MFRQHRKWKKRCICKSINSVFNNCFYIIFTFVWERFAPMNLYLNTIIIRGLWPYCVLWIKLWSLHQWVWMKIRGFKIYNFHIILFQHGLYNTSLERSWNMNSSVMVNKVYVVCVEYLIIPNKACCSKLKSSASSFRWGTFSKLAYICMIFGKTNKWTTKTNKQQQKQSLSKIPNESYPYSRIYVST